MVSIEYSLVRLLPNLKRSLRLANIKRTPEQYVKRTLRLTGYGTFAIAAFIFFVTARTLPLAAVVAVMVFATFLGSVLLFLFLVNAPSGIAKKRQRDIDKDVLFAGRYMLMKIESGSPIISALADASKGYGIAAKYFKEIIDRINTGIPVEDALEEARSYASSEKFKKILWQLLVTLKTGTDVVAPLKTALASIAKEQIIEIQAYGRKLNSLMLFYMVTGCVAPSLGFAMFIIIGSFISLELNNSALFAVLFFLVILQGFFLIIIKAARPSVDI
ncbi:MAG TPA: type II secretion system F family protein [Candidatus Nanoarchaeia archaeon]|nr:type II secretion system F family protein [Candidatus Nanoarchaeia archaeon]